MMLFAISSLLEIKLMPPPNPPIARFRRMLVPAVILNLDTSLIPPPESSTVFGDWRPTLLFEISKVSALIAPPFPQSLAAPTFGHDASFPSKVLLVMLGVIVSPRRLPSELIAPPRRLVAFEEK